MSVLNKLYKAKDSSPLASTKAAIQSAAAYPYYCNRSMLSSHPSAKPLENPMGSCFPFTNTWTEALEDSAANLASNLCCGTLSTIQSRALMSSLRSTRAAFTCCCLNPNRSSCDFKWSAAEASDDTLFVVKGDNISLWWELFSLYSNLAAPGTQTSKLGSSAPATLQQTCEKTNGLQRICTDSEPHNPWHWLAKTFNSKHETLNTTVPGMSLKMVMTRACL